MVLMLSLICANVSLKQHCASVKPDRATSMIVHTSSRKIAKATKPEPVNRIMLLTELLLSGHKDVWRIELKCVTGIFKNDPRLLLHIYIKVFFI